MKCRKCKKEIPDYSTFCLWCGNKLHRDSLRRANGSGTAYKRGRTWTAKWCIKYWKDELGEEHRETSTKGGFKTKKEALKFAEQMQNKHLPELRQETLNSVYERWLKSYIEIGRCGPDTIACYKSAFNHFEKLKPLLINEITTNHLQQCINDTQTKSRTKQNMRTVIGLVFKFAISDRLIAVNPAMNLYVKSNDTVHRSPLTDDDLAAIKKAFDTEPYAKYVYCMAYLGFRPTEFFTLKKTSYFNEEKIEYLVNGEKTTAGIDRAVTIPPIISNLIAEQLKIEGTEYLFPRIVKNGYTEMKEDYYRKHVFSPLMDRLNIKGKVPYSARHTYANKIKKAQGADKDKAALMGHEEYKTTKKNYQSTDLIDRKEITDQLV